MDGFLSSYLQSTLPESLFALLELAGCYTTAPLTFYVGREAQNW